jgi:hypothetical protein
MIRTKRTWLIKARQYLFTGINENQNLLKSILTIELKVPDYRIS